MWSKVRQVSSPLLVFLFSILAIIACGGSTGSIGFDVTAQPENVIIEGLPQYICPTATPIATNTPVPTSVQPPIIYPPSGYAPYTAVPGCVYYGSICVPNTPAFGGLYTTPAYSVPGATSTPPSTYTPYPSPTPFTSSYYYFFDDDVFTTHASSTLDLRLQIGTIRTALSSTPGLQITVWEVQIENKGTTSYIVLPPVQIYVSSIAGVAGTWGVSQLAADELGIILDTGAVDGLEVLPGQTYIFDMVAYTPIGSVDSLAYILNPYANGYDGQIAGGNLAYWIDGNHADCVGNVNGGIIPTPSTPNPTPTPTPTIESCLVISCLTQLP